jgi:Domain of unknown function (DUF4157)
MTRAISAQQGKTTNSRPPTRGILQRQCACGTHVTPGGECVECGKNKSGLQRRLAIGAINDPLEQEADRVADQVLAAPAHPAVSGAPPRIQRYAGQAFGGMDTAPTSVDRVLASSGKSLDPALRQNMERRFGQDFSRVRVHTGGAAEQSARDVNADAYTVGNNVVFGAGQFAPGYHDGLRLLAHELTHVVQQSGSDRTYVDQRREKGSLSPIIVQRKKRADKADKKAAQGASFWFSVKISSELDSADLLVEFVRQYYRLASIAEAVQMRDENNWAWIGTPQVATKEDTAKGYILLHVADNSIRQQDEASKKESAGQFGQLGADDQSAINSEADREFWEKSQYKVGTKLGSSSDDKKMSEYWIAIRNELLRQRKAIDALPPNIKKFLFTDDAPRAIEPKDYATALRIAEKLSKLTDTELEDYKSKVNTQTADWSVFEGSIDSFVEERARRKEEAKDLDKKKTKIYGLEELYRKYKTWKDVEGTARSIPSHDEGGYDPNHEYFQRVEDDAKADLLANLPRYGFKSIEDFEQAIADYEDAFARETVNIGFDMLAKYDHLLYEEEKKYSNKANADALAQAIGKTTAKADYESASSSESAARGITPDPEIHRYMPGELEMKQRLQREGASSRASAESQVTSAAASVSGVPEPLIGNKDFDREKLARTDMSQVQSIMLEYIAARRKDVRDTRGHLSGDPDLIYKLDDLWKASKEQQDIRQGTIYDLIISDKISRVHKSEALIKILLGVFTVVLSIVSFGTGAIAAVAAVGAFGLSAYQAIESFKEYEVGHAAAGAQLLSKDPSFAWVIVAFVGAAVDLGVAAKAISKMKGAIDAFNAAGELGDLVKLETELTEIEEAGKITAEMHELTVKAAAAQKEYRAAMKGLAAKTMGRANAMLPLDAIPDLAKAIYYAAKRGVASFEKFMLELKAEKAYAELALEPEELTKFKAAFEEAKEGVESLTSHGESLGLKEKEMDAFVESWSRNKTATVEEMKEEMSAAVETQRLTRRYEQMTDQQVRDILKSDPDAPFELMRRYRLKSKDEVRQLAKGDDDTAQMILREREAALRDARAGARTMPAEQPVWNRLEDRLLAKRTVTPKTSKTGTMAMAETDLALKERNFEGGSIKTGEVPDPTYKPPTDFPRDQGHAEQNILGKLKAAIEEAGLDKADGAFKGKKVWILVDQEVCTTCRTGLMSDIIKEGKPSGVLQQFSRDFPDLTIEVTDWGTGKVWRMIGGKPLR